MEIVTIIYLVMAGTGTVALLLLVQEVAAFCGEARRLRHALHTELMELEKLLLRQEGWRIQQAAREARERLAAMPAASEGIDEFIDIEWTPEETEAHSAVISRSALPPADTGEKRALL